MRTAVPADKDQATDRQRQSITGTLEEARPYGRCARNCAGKRPQHPASLSDINIYMLRSRYSEIIIAPVKLSWDEAKRQRTLVERGLDFADAAEVFADRTFTFPDERKGYGETRNITIGFLRDRMIVVVWTRRSAARHIISMRKANEREIAKYQERLG